MSLSSGYSVSPTLLQKYQGPRLVCKLLKSIYGLRQAPHCWFMKLCSALLDFGFKQCACDHSMFVFTQQGSITVFLVYVDDMVLAGNDQGTMTKVKLFLSTRFQIKDLGHLKYFLGLELACSSQGIHLHQKKYAQDLLTDVGLLNCKSSVIPLKQNNGLLTDLSTETDFHDVSLYRRVIGRLIYLTISRHDIAYTLNTLAQFMSKPKVYHYHVVLKILRYLKETAGQGLLFSASSSLKLTAFSYADWAACRITRRSITGFCVMLGASLISWRSKK
ncbi:hypothetical protein DCAR_0205621 [Daucus carota subsp. sativus]|uniref:Reverse transcriptase Ty1/copia-type domain-containing protein n=2 Tax=Daucus carota subsp. sativus TaxID=79200 RepID=A0AAF1AMX3_DAUCS|nr:PREDICTED: uncharacterized mitochondrial protein AtMg00810-like [Daucus carota subsp. sativus]WOG86417.1 hypothetical protein DCAR_0205621 [Daucus carota subsp. sativus]